MEYYLIANIQSRHLPTDIRTEPNDSDCPPPSKKKILQQLNRLKYHKTPGENEIQEEVLKNLNEGTVNIIHSIIESIWNEKRLPED